METEVRFLKTIKILKFMKNVLQTFQFISKTGIYPRSYYDTLAGPLWTNFIADVAGLWTLDIFGIITATIRIVYEYISFVKLLIMPYSFKKNSSNLLLPQYQPSLYPTTPPIPLVS